MTRAERLGLEPGSVPLDRIEPGALSNEGQAGLISQEDALASIAISLKRIADAICGDAHSIGIRRAICDIANRVSE